MHAKFEEVAQTLFDKNFVLAETLVPRFLMTTSMTDDNGSIAFVKLWWEAISNIYGGNNSEVSQAWMQCESEEGQANFLQHINDGLRRKWVCFIKMSSWVRQDGQAQAEVNVNVAEPIEEKSEI